MSIYRPNRGQPMTKKSKIRFSNPDIENKLNKVTNYNIKFYNLI